jgi:uncharacterized protein involved in copper resistance
MHDRLDGTKSKAAIWRLNNANISTFWDGGTGLRAENKEKVRVWTIVQAMGQEELEVLCRSFVIVVVVDNYRLGKLFSNSIIAEAS